MCGLLIVGASLVEHGLQGLWVSAVAVRGLHSCDSWALERWLSSCGAGAELLHVTWDLPGSGIEPLASTLAGKFFITRPQGWLVSMGCVVSHTIEWEGCSNSSGDGEGISTAHCLTFCSLPFMH